MHVAAYIGAHTASVELHARNLPYSRLVLVIP